MRVTPKRRRWLRRGAWFAVLLGVVAAVGCNSLSFYRQAARGQFQLLVRQAPIQRVLDDPETPPELARKLRLVLDLRAFAGAKLALPVDDHYLRYADLGRPYVVWNIHAAPHLSMEPKRWWYPIVGSLNYRGYFDEDSARRYAGELGAEEYDVFVEGVEAYSTLGWFRDPVLNTFIHHREAALAEIIFHELGHQRLFLRGDTDFNEAFATAVGREGVRRWLRQSGREDASARYEEATQREQQFVDLVLATRSQLEQLFGDSDSTPSSEDQAARDPIQSSPAFLKVQKAALYDQLRRGYDGLKASWNGYAGYDGWFGESLNNAKLNTVATYFDLVPAFDRLLSEVGGDLATFYERAEAYRKLKQPERRERLEVLAATLER